ncbi:hypothetical protein Clacol_000089 [Clathrus columnatus]|uniref:Uncharacterized protein n=1 Tax=Clathrus columnatus TaxID=1419009 RepID=A0AAV4ZXT6_9AGAM|nr:hypothetical protein Clacol_000089 [Clathrus columnatus]
MPIGILHGTDIKIIHMSRSLVTMELHHLQCQLPSAAAVASSIARDAKSGRLAQILTGQTKAFQRVIGIGHSIGSVVFNYEVIKDGASSPYDGLVLTVESISTIASQADPGRFGNLDSGYETTNGSERSIYYGPTNNSFSPVMFQLDVLTLGVGSIWLAKQTRFVYVPALGYRGPVVEIVGEFDQLHCIPDGGPCVQSLIQKPEPAFFPQSINVTTVSVYVMKFAFEKVFITNVVTCMEIVIPGTGHSLNAEFAASLTFRIINDLFRDCVYKV